jgi:hypothetical protein
VHVAEDVDVVDEGVDDADQRGNVDRAQPHQRRPQNCEKKSRLKTPKKFRLNPPKKIPTENTPKN